MHQILIRQVERGDLSGCYRLEKLCYDEFEVAPRDFLEKRIDVYPDGFYVAEMDGKIIGMVNSGATHRDDIADEELKYLIGHVRNGRNSVVFSLAVHPDYRGRGVARRLMEKLIEVSTMKQKKKIFLLCRKSLVTFYTQLGFTCTGPSLSGFGGQLHFQMQYELPAPVWLTTSHHSSSSLLWQ